MNIRNVATIVLSALVAAGFALALSGCFGIPKGTTDEVAVGALTIRATGAGILKADAQKTTFQIRCRVCGYVEKEITIDTPASAKPYTMDWVCPDCGHKQQIVVQTTAP